MKKVLILQDMPLYTYRVYMYNALAQRGYNVTVVSLSNTVIPIEESLSFTHLRKSFVKAFSFIWINKFSDINLRNYDVIIVAPNVRVFNYNMLSLNYKYKQKLIAWGHMRGRSAGNCFAQIFREFILRRLKALIFYDQLTLQEFVTNGYNPKQLFLANNTQYVDNSNLDLEKEREYFLFVGRLQERKGLNILLESFSLFKRSTNSNVGLKIIGNGAILKELVLLAESYGISGSVDFLGQILDERQLKNIFEKAIAYVSPGHVGLGVLHSLAFGVPVITCKGRNHAPEVSNCNDSNSFFVDFNSKSISDKMIELCFDSKLLKSMSLAAIEYYNKYCTLELMIDGIEQAIDSVQK